MSYFSSASLRTALMGSVAAVVLVAQPASAQAVKSFNIPAEDAATAIPAFVQQSGLQVLATASDLQGVRTNAVAGSLSVDAALSALIANTGLTIKTHDAASAVIVKASATSDAAPAAASQEVVVVGIRKSMRDALATKRAETGVVEVVSSKDIGILPDVTIAETLARLPGLNTTRDRGNDSQAAIRGLGPRMVLGLINGREMASSEPDRNVRWEVFPSEVVSGVEVYKSSEAKLVSGGISGTVDLQTIRPLDYRGPALTVRAGPVYYDGGSSLPNYKTLGYRASGAYVTKLTPQLGWVLAASYQDQKNGYENINGGGWNTATTVANGASKLNGVLTFAPWGASFEEKAIDTTRASVSSSLQWKPTDHFEGRFDILESDIKIKENDDGGWYSGWGNWAGDGTEFSHTTVQNGSLVAATINDSYYNPYVAKYQQDMKLFATGLNGKWHYDDWTVTADSAYSQAERYGLWQATYMYDDAGVTSWNYIGASPSVTATTSAWQAAQSGKLFAGNGDADVSHLKDMLQTDNLDFTKDINGSFWTSLKFGGRYSDRTKLDAEVKTVATPAPLSSAAVSASLFAPWNYKSFSVPTFIYGDFQKVATAVYGTAGYAALNPDFKHTPFVSKVHEKVAEAYLEGTYATTFMGKPLDGNMGVRAVSVDSTSRGPSNGTVITVGQKYTKILPSFNSRLALDDNAYLKFDLSQALSRPPLNDLRVDRSLNLTSGAPTGGGGNPYLKPYMADQLDLSYENYFRKDGLFAAAFFVKNISNYIGYSTIDTTLPGVTLPSPYKTISYTSPNNDPKNGTLSGLEFTYQTPFYFIPGLEKFGIYSNAAFTASNIHENTPAGNPFPMNGVAKTTATLDLWYADASLDARLGFKYHTPFTLLYGWDSSGLTAIRSELTMDFSSTYRINDQMSVRFQAGNLLNTPLRTYDNNNKSEIDRTDHYGRRFLLDLTLKY